MGPPRIELETSPLNGRNPDSGKNLPADMLEADRQIADILRAYDEGNSGTALTYEDFWSQRAEQFSHLPQDLQNLLGFHNLDFRYRIVDDRPLYLGHVRGAQSTGNPFSTALATATVDGPLDAYAGLTEDRIAVVVGYEPGGNRQLRRFNVSLTVQEVNKLKKRAEFHGFMLSDQLLLQNTTHPSDNTAPITPAMTRKASPGTLDLREIAGLIPCIQ